MAFYHYVQCRLECRKKMTPSSSTTTDTHDTHVDADADEDDDDEIKMMASRYSTKFVGSVFCVLCLSTYVCL